MSRKGKRIEPITGMKRISDYFLPMKKKEIHDNKPKKSIIYNVDFTTSIEEYSLLYDNVSHLPEYFSESDLISNNKECFGLCGEYNERIKKKLNNPWNTPMICAHNY